VVTAAIPDDGNIQDTWYSGTCFIVDHKTKVKSRWLYTSIHITCLCMLQIHAFTDSDKYYITNSKLWLSICGLL